MENMMVSQYINENVTPYDGDESFLAGPTEKTIKCWDICKDLLGKEASNNGVLLIDSKVPSSLTSHGAGYLDKDLDNVIVGFQGDQPLQRTMKPLGGHKLVKMALKERGLDMEPELESIFENWRKTHNDGVFDIYNADMRAARKAGVITGLPDNYGRGRIIGDYRRVALYGIDALVAAKQADKKHLGKSAAFTDDVIRLTEEVSEQIRALGALKTMAQAYGFDISKPATNAKEAVQWVYFGYLGAIKQQDGAAMSLGRVDAFLDIYFQLELEAGTLTESEAQEIIDHFVMKLRLVRHLRPAAYDEIFAGDPTWVTATIGGCKGDGSGHLVTKTAYRIIHSLTNLGPAPEPNITILWDAEGLPQNFKVYCGKMSCATCSLQYENETLMRDHPSLGRDDISIACCVSAMVTGKQMQLFGARCNMPKLLLYTLNGGCDEKSGAQVGPKFSAVPEGPLQYDDVIKRLEEGMEWLAQLYVSIMNAIHYMHDKYNYESLEMALHDTDVHRFIAFGMAGLSVMADSLSAIKFASVTPVRDPESGLTTDFEIQGEFPMYGNDDDRVDDIAKHLVEMLIGKLRKHPTYRGAEHTLSILTITSNVMYGKKTGSTPDGRKACEPYAPGANPGHGRDHMGALASLNSVSKIPYEACVDGVSNTFTMIPSTLGKCDADRAANVASLLDGYFAQKAHHLNVNVLNRETLRDAMENPLNYPQLTIRVSGYAVMFNRLSRAQQLEVISRTFHEAH
mmetsp:Transcript_3111/g.4182  ORF Transcript_3111/g.4182 Transcript_3111/m.4182 type:complete len:739 (-) Transcript_3111:183-2399(-)|eukprot:CAMPEP_0196599794 /NCGR_PEP_ID=MMETSP1081-20130531/95036_1 /TAXON_ID=36882 /ORGANISM="Pyramimonas amylifera, Strain CCMP720" /LENGTH=738 /DNA_ID=CAMNT_0041925585 /DNA_START=106 /DNA_END=2322 /DNA_ORIENTATION=+